MSRVDRRLSVRLGITKFGVFAVVLASIVACAPSAASPSAPAILKIVTTTTVFADIVSNVAGDRASVASIIPPGVGPEDYEPKPNDARLLDGADLVVSNGVGLDDFLDKLIQSSTGGDAPRLVLGDGIPPIVVDGEANPHFWLDPTLVRDDYLPAIVRTLSQIDPAGAATYQSNAATYGATLTSLDAELAKDVESVPQSNRKLVTFHDAFPYFARHYGFEVIGVILANPGQEPSAGVLAKLVETVKAAGVKAVFSEAQFSPGLAQTLADEAGITSVVTTLYNDALGPAPADTYVGLMRWNVAQIVGALR
jgi:ABC-type Zn uptake system ZnuABC Zn-binding protein ZnuA